MQFPLSDLISALGIPGIVGYLLWKEIMNFMRRKENGGDARGSYRELKEKIEEFTNKGTPQTLETFSHLFEKQTYVMQRMLDQMQDNKDRLQRIEDLLHKR